MSFVENLLARQCAKKQMRRERVLDLHRPARKSLGLQVRVRKLARRADRFYDLRRRFGF
jgi:hypothetical protein